MMLVVQANTNSSQVVLTACSPFVSVVFERSRLTTFFALADTNAEAIQLLR